MWNRKLIQFIDYFLFFSVNHFRFYYKFINKLYLYRKCVYIIIFSFVYFGSKLNTLLFSFLYRKLFFLFFTIFYIKTQQTMIIIFCQINNSSQNIIILIINKIKCTIWLSAIAFNQLQPNTNKINHNHNSDKKIKVMKRRRRWKEKSCFPSLEYLFSKNNIKKSINSKHTILNRVLFLFNNFKFSFVHFYNQ